MGVIEAESLIDLGVEPELGTLPQLETGIQRGVDGLAPLRGAVQAIGARIGRAERRIGLLGECCLAVEADHIRKRRQRCCGVRNRRVAGQVIIQAQTKFLQCQAGADPRSQVGVAGHRVGKRGPQKFALRGPVRCDGHFDARAGRPAESPQKKRVVDAAGDLREGELIIGPGEATRQIKQPVSGRIANAAAQRAERQHRLTVTGRTKDRRVEVGQTPDRQPVEILKGGKRGVGFHAEHHAIGQHVIVAALNPHEEASHLGEVIDRQGHADRAGGRWQSRPRRVGGPVRVSAGIAQMAAHIEPGPIVEAGDRRRLDRKRRQISGGSRRDCTQGRKGQARDPCQETQETLAQSGPINNGVDRTSALSL
jgi:hypothetical protein